MNEQPVSSAGTGSIRPELLAAKMAAIRNLEYPAIAQQIDRRPRLAEMLWFLQWVSFQPGGLLRFAQEILSRFPERIGTPTLVASQSPKLTLQEKVTIYHELPEYCVRDLPASNESPIAALLDSTTADEIEAWKRSDQRQLENALKSLDREEFSKRCREKALEALPRYLASLCNEIDRGFEASPREAWYFQDIIGAVIEMMDLQTSASTAHLAQTAVTDKVFEALDYALSEQCMVRIEGNSRFGKTEAVKAWCHGRPGLARLVNVPCSNTLIDLLRKIADSLGISYSYSTCQNELKSKVEFTIKHSRLFIVLDEGAFLLPQSYNKTSAPARLNWVRTEIVDQGLPLALVVTPQSFHPALKRFVRSTGYAIEQFVGRTLWPVSLPSELDAKDLVAVARVHFPELDENALNFVAGASEASEDYLMAVEAISKRARFIAKREGHRSVSVTDLETAVKDVLPSASAPLPASATAPVSIQTPRARKPLARPIQPAGRRAPQIADEPETDFDRRSLRGAGLERTEAELMPVES